MVYFERIESVQLAADTSGTGTNVLILPGLYDSPALHWQSRWQQLFGYSRVAFGEWESPTLHGWTKRLEDAVAAGPDRLLLVGHSLGSLAAVWWARSSHLVRRVSGALLVAPPDVDREDCATALRDFRPTPERMLPFPSVLVASRNDKYASFEASERMARVWGSRLVDCGKAGHINADSGLGCWTEGLSLLLGLMDRDGEPVRNWLLAGPV
jgi:predicted alpha/beta hydrolase family esterase